MKLTPLDIRKQEFKRVMRGYDPVEVDTFMDMMANEFEEVLKSQKEMRDRLVELDVQLKDYRQIEKTLQQTLSPGPGDNREDIRNRPQGGGVDRPRGGAKGRADR